MTAASRQSVRRTALRAASLGAGGLVALGLFQLAASPAAADRQVEQGSVPLSSVSSTNPVTVPQFDPADGTLEQVTVTLTVAGNTSVEVTNLTPAAKATTVTIDATASVAGPGVNALAVSPTASQSQSINSAAAFMFGVNASGTQQQVVTAADLAAFVGGGSVTFNVTGAVAVDVEGPATWRASGSHGGTATVQVEYQFNHAPVAVNDVATVGEDAAASSIDVFANDTDVDAGSMVIASASDPAHGAVVVTAGGAGLTYQPDPNYCNSQTVGTPDTFTYTLSPGTSTATVSVTVTCVDDAPVAVADTATATEDAVVPLAIDVLANDTDVEDDAISVVSVAQPANGASAITGGGAGVSYSPVADFCGTDTFTYTLNGGSAATVTVTVTCVNDAPIVATTATPLTYTENDGPVAVDSGVTVTDDGLIAGATIQVTSGFVSAEDELSFIDQLGIAGSYDDATGTLTLTGTTTAANYQTALREVNYENTSDNPSTVTRTVSLRITDDGALDSNIATRNVTVIAVNEAPVITTSAGAAVYTEGNPATTVDGGLTVIDIDDTDLESAQVRISVGFQPGDDLVFVNTATISGVYNSGTGVLTVTGTSSVANYEIALRSIQFQSTSDDPATSKMIEFIVNDGSAASAPATKAISVTPVDDPPVAVVDSATVAEDSGASAVDVLANDTDIDAGPKTISSASDPANGTVVITGGGSGLTYQPDPNYCNSPPGTTPDTFTYTLNGGSTSTVSVTVTCVDDAPVAVDDTATVFQNSPPTAILVLANDTDIDGGPKTVTATGDPVNGTVVITGGGTGLTYQPDPTFCSATPDTFTYTLNGGSSATVSVTVDCDAAPVAVNDGATVGEDAAASAIDVLANDTDADGGPKSIGSTSDPANGTVVITGGGSGLTYQPDPNYCNSPPGTTPDTFTYTLNGGSTATVSVTVTCVDDPPTAVDDSATVLEDAAATAIPVLTNDTDPDGGPKTIASASDPANGTVVITGGGTGLTYQPDANFCSATPDTFTYTLNGGSTATVSATVTCVPDNPVVDTSAGSASYTENAAATVIDAAVTVTDPDAGTTITGATVAITGGFAGAEDVLALAGVHPGITAGVQVGNTLTLTGNASAAAYQAALRDVTYRNTSDAPSTAPRTVTFTVTDDTARTGSDTKGITVSAVDDPPAAVNDSATVLEDAAATAIPVLTNDTDIDGGPKSIASVTQPANGSVTITGGGTGLTYQPNPNYCNDPPGTTPSTFTYTVNGGSSATVSVTVTCVNDAPVADDETFDNANGAIGNTTLVVNDPDDGAITTTDPHKTIVGDILTGDSDIDGPGPLVVTAGTFTTNDGGSVTIESDGDFTFRPVAVTSCTDTSDFFDYAVSDQNPGTPLTDTGRVTISIAGCVWYVNNNNPAGNSGTSSAPFDTLAQAETASGSNHTVFVFDGSNTSSGYDTGYAMDAGERLIGEHEGLTVDPDGGGPLSAVTLQPASPGAHPTLTANNEDVIALDDGNEVRGFNLDPQGTGGGIGGASGDTGGGTIDDINITDSGTFGTQPGLELDTTTGTFNISNITVSTNGAIGVRLNNAGTVNFAATGTISIASAGAAGLVASGTNLGTSAFDSITVMGSTSGGVSLTSTTGASTFTDLALTTTSGSTPAFGLSNAGTVTVSAAGTTNLNATGGPAVDVTGTAGATLAFDSVSSNNSANDGINLDGLGTGTFSAASGTIAGAVGISFDLNGGSGDVTYPGSLNNGSGITTVEITGRSGGAVTLAGAIADTNDAGGGIILSGNTGGSTTFSNASKVINSTTANAVSMTTSDGHTLTLSGGGLDIDTTTGIGINADASGTLNVAGSGNTVASTTGRAVRVVATDFGALGFTLQSVSSNGAPNGILLSSTGATSGMTITGTGAPNSGGTIQNATEHGVALTSTNNFNSDELSITGANFAGIDGTDVTNFTFTDGEILNAGDALVNDLHAAFAFNDLGANNVDGQLTITGNSVTNPYGGGVQVRNAAGTIATATISTNTFQSATDPATSKQDGVSLFIEGTPTTAASLTQAAISGNTILNFPSGSGVELVGAQITSTTGPRVTFGIPDSTTRVVVSNNDIRGNATNKMGVFGVSVSVTGMADGNVQVSNNGTAAVPMQNILGEGIGVGASGTSNADFIIENNFVAPGNILGNVGISANANRRDVGGTILATPDVNVTIQNNTVSNTSGAGIKVLHFNSNGNLRAKIINNSVSAPLQPNPGIAVENGSSNDAAFNPTLCVQLTNNPATGSGPDGFGNVFAGIDLIERGNSATTYRLQVHGLTPNPATAAQTETFLAGQNPASSLGAGFYAGKRATVSEGSAFEACTITF